MGNRPVLAALLCVGCLAEGRKWTSGPVFRLGKLPPGKYNVEIRALPKCHTEDPPCTRGMKIFAQVSDIIVVE